MIIEGLKLLVLGMGIVYIFLVLISVIIIVQGYLCKTITQREVANKQTIPRSPSTQVKPIKDSVDSENTDELLAVISAAISFHRKIHN